MRRHLKQRLGMTTIEMLLIFATFVVATFAFARLGISVIQVYFVDGHQMTGIPFL